MIIAVYISMKIIYIYCLKDTNGNIRYVGKTNNIKRRLQSHISEAKKIKGKRYVLNWISSLIKNNQKPILEVLEECNELNWQEREIYWINYYRSINPNLCNICDGGIGATGSKNYSPEEIQKRRKLLSIKRSKFSENTKIVIWELIKENKTYNDIKNIYPNYSKQMNFGIRNGRQWNLITLLPITKGSKKQRKGYTYNKGLYIVRKIINNKKKVLFSSKNEEDVINYLKTMGS